MNDMSYVAPRLSKMSFGRYIQADIDLSYL
jgi:hypothetical protein